MVATSPLDLTVTDRKPDLDRDGGPAVALTRRGLVVHELLETDSEVLRVVREADDPAAAVQQCLRVGARAVLAANVTVETHIVEKRFDAMTDRFDEQVDAAVTRIATAAESLLDEHDGALPHALEAHRSQLDQLLGDTFDPDSKVSVLALFETVLADAHREHVHTITRLVDADGDESPLGRLRLEVVSDLKEHVGEVRKDVAALSERIAVHEAVAPVLELTSGKGFRFEDVVDARVSALAAAHGDVAERVGTETGSAGTQKGDEVVTLNLDDTQGYDARFVLEAKSRKLTMRATLKELDEALDNREALAAIAVFARQEQAPTSVAFHYAGNKAVVVLDPEGADDSALRLAYMWARWVVRRELAGTDADELDCSRITTLLDDAARAIDRCTTIRKYHTQARRGIERAGAEVDALADEVRDALAAIADELAGTGTGTGTDTGTGEVETRGPVT
jgi:hypothetical protein